MFLFARIALVAFMLVAASGCGAYLSYEPSIVLQLPTDLAQAENAARLHKSATSTPIRIADASGIGALTATEKRNRIKDLLDKYGDLLDSALTEQAFAFGEEITKTTEGMDFRIKGPSVAPGDQWSIILDHVSVADDADFWAAGEIAVLLRVNSGTNSEIDKKWILAGIDPHCSSGYKMNMDNIVVWSGVATRAVVVEIKLVDLEKRDQAELEGYLQILAEVAGAIPEYGPIARQLVKIGSTLNTSSSDHEILLHYSKGFHPDEELHYGVYVMMPVDELTLTNYTSLYYDGAGEVVEWKDGTFSKFKHNWVALRVAKGQLETFEVARSAAEKDLIDLGNSISMQHFTSVASTELKTAIANLVSATAVVSVAKETSFRDAYSVSRATRLMKDLVQDPNLNIRQEDLDRFLKQVRGVLPEEWLSEIGAPVVGEPGSAEDSWKKLLEKITELESVDAGKSRYTWDPRKLRLVKRK